MYKEISSCRICGNTEFDSLLDLGSQALTGVFPKRLDEEVEAGPLHLVKCREQGRKEACGLVQLKHSFAASQMYGDNYGYRSGLNASMVQHLNAKAAAIKKRVALKPGDVVLDIGSNDCTTLRAMHEKGVQAVGMDPTGAKFKSFYPEHVKLICDFFSSARFRQELGDRKAKVVTSIAMFYDLESPLQFMREIKEVLANDGIWVFEQSHMPTMLKMNSYDTICHEHLEYYALKQIQYLAERAGLKILDVEFNDINGGSFSVVAAHAASSLPQNGSLIGELLKQESASGLEGLAPYAEFRERVLRHKEVFSAFLRDTAARGQKLFGYGASTKGNVILQFCDVSPKEMPFIVEVNKDKFGSFTPQTRIPIISEEEGRQLRPDFLLVLPWHFRKHIIPREERFLKAGGRLVFPLPDLDVVAHA